MLRNLSFLFVIPLLITLSTVGNAITSPTELIQNHLSTAPYQVLFQINDDADLIPHSSLIGEDTLYFATTEGTRWDIEDRPNSVGDQLFFLETQSRRHFLASLQRAKNQIKKEIFGSDRTKYKKVVFQVPHKWMPDVIVKLESVWAELDMTLSGLNMEVEYMKMFSNPDYTATLENVGTVLSQLAKTLMQIGKYGAAIPVYDDAFILSSEDASNIFQIIAMIENGDFYTADKKLVEMEKTYESAALPDSIGKRVFSKINLAKGVLFYAQNKMSSALSAFARSLRYDPGYFMNTLNKRDRLAFGNVSKAAFRYYLESQVVE